MSVTIKQIAEKAGVSRGPVDRVINNRGHVKPEIEERVQKIAKELGYRPNAAGKALAARKKNFIIGVILCARGNEFFDDILKGIKGAEQEAAEFGIQVVVKTMKGYQVEEQLRLMDQLEEQIHFLILNPINDERIAGKINELSEKNIPVITVNTDIEGSRRLCYVGCDYLKSGRTACGIPGIATDGKGRVGIATGSVKILGHNQRIRGFYKTQKKRFPELNILDIVETEDDKETGYTQTLLMLNRHPEINAVYIAAAAADGVCRAVSDWQSGNTELPHPIKIVGSDLTPSISKLLKEERILGTICQQPWTQGYQSVTLAVHYLVNGQKPAREYFYMKNEIKIPENL